MLPLSALLLERTALYINLGLPLTIARARAQHDIETHFGRSHQPRCAPCVDLQSDYDDERQHGWANPENSR